MLNRQSIRTGNAFILHAAVSRDHVNLRFLQVVRDVVIALPCATSEQRWDLLPNSAQTLCEAFELSAFVISFEIWEPELGDAQPTCKGNLRSKENA